MNLRHVLRWLLLPAVWLGVITLRAAQPAGHIDDPGALLPTEPSAAGILDHKLTEFERTSGIRILVRFHAKSPSAAEDAQPGAFMRALAGELGVAQRSVLAVYFADEDDWRVWIGDELTATFVGRPGSVHELTESGAIHDAKETFFAAARAAGDAAWTELQESSQADRQPAPAERVELHAEAIVDGLIARFGTRRPRAP